MAALRLSPTAYGLANLAADAESLIEALDLQHYLLVGVVSLSVVYDERQCRLFASL